MVVDPNVWLSRQPGFIAIAEQLGRGPLEFAREYTASLETNATVHVTDESLLEVMGDHVETWDVVIPEGKYDERFEDLMRKLKRNERQISLVRDDLEASLLDQ